MRLVGAVVKTVTIPLRLVRLVALRQGLALAMGTGQLTVAAVVAVGILKPARRSLAAMADQASSSFGIRASVVPTAER